MFEIHTCRKTLARIICGKKCFYAYKDLMKSKLLNGESKLRIYKTVIRQVVTYGCETWTRSTTDENQLRIFERKILRKIFGPTQCSDGSWRIKMNHELNELMQSADIVRFVKSQRLNWLGHLERMPDNRVVKVV
ncbi:unnamed protein product [Diabrotica balteata]|uniref:Uncharacterized protein n=1 Tax=Diabrotica balteata TaxID=107213 RepID=A0A9N9XDI5_DIABA|nr:unnamed protein product [Diabrotica balteata]